MRLQKSYISDVQLGKKLVIGMRINGKTLYNKSGPWSMSFTVEGLADKNIPLFNSEFSYDITRDGYYDSDDLFYGSITISAKTENSYPSIINFYGTWGRPDTIKSIDRIDYIDEEIVGISFMNCSNVTFIDTSELEKILYATNSYVSDESGIFSGCHALRELNVKMLDVSGMSNMSATFKNCRSLRTLDLSNWDTSNVDDMRSMFENCYALTSLDVSNFDTSKVGLHGFINMFSGCSSLTELDLSSFIADAQKINYINLSYMFNNCTSLTKLDLSNFVTRTDIYSTFDNTFKECNNLREIRLDNCSYKFINDILYGKLPDNEIEGITKTIHCKKSEAYGVRPSGLGIWRLSYIEDIPDLEGIPRFEPHEFYNNKEITEVTTMVDEYNKYLTYMFIGCSNLVSVNTQDWDTSNVNTMFGMFSNCSSLEEINLNNLNITNVTDMQYMFSGCSSLTALDLSNWNNTSKVTSMFQMFYNCSSLEEVDMSNFDADNVTNMHYIFGNCNNLHTLYLNNCSANTINKIITSSGFPDDNAGIIYCKRTETIDLTEPGNWSFSYID